MTTKTYKKEDRKYRFRLNAGFHAEAVEVTDEVNGKLVPRLNGRGEPTIIHERYKPGDTVYSDDPLDKINNTPGDKVQKFTRVSKTAKAEEGPDLLPGQLPIDETLEGMSDKELRSHAQAEEIDIPKGAKREDIIALIKKHSEAVTA